MKVHFSDIVMARLTSPSVSISSMKETDSEIPIENHQPDVKSNVKQSGFGPRFNPLEAFTKKPKKHRAQHKYTAGRTGMVVISSAVPPPLPR